MGLPRQTIQRISKRPPLENRRGDVLVMILRREKFFSAALLCKPHAFHLSKKMALRNMASSR
jgi:hypothetical protein